MSGQVEKHEIENKICNENRKTRFAQIPIPASVPVPFPFPAFSVAQDTLLTF